MTTLSSASEDGSQINVNGFLGDVWIRNPLFDQLLVTGGAYITLLVAFVTFQQPQLLPIFFWIWVICFEGSHFWATFSRTYFDTKFRNENKGFLYGSLVFFLFPIMAILLEMKSPNISFTTIYGLFIFIWSLYHNARQHFGFLSIYMGKAKIKEAHKKDLVKSLYFSIIFSQIYFLLNFKITGIFGAVPSDHTLNWIVSSLPGYLTTFTLGFFLFNGLKLLKVYQAKLYPSLFYIFSCLVFYSTMFYFIAPQDLFIQNTSGVQKLILIAIMNSLFHNIQYHAIVWHYGKSRYSNNEQKTSLGYFAFLFNSKTINYIGFALLMGTIFAVIVWNVGDSPNLSGSFVESHGHKWAYILFFGIIGHHFYLDQKIWRPSKQKDLKSYIK